MFQRVVIGETVFFQHCRASRRGGFLPREIDGASSACVHGTALRGAVVSHLRAGGKRDRGPVGQQQPATVASGAAALEDRVF